MSDSSVLTQFTSRVVPALPNCEPESETDAGQVDNLGTFGWLRGARERAIMLELRRKDGNVVALGYAWLERIDFDPSVGVTLKFAGQTVKIVGRNLNAEIRPNVRLLDGLIRHRVPWIQEADEPALLRADRHATVIEHFELAEGGHSHAAKT
jgi:hypothetical protein